MLYDTVFTSFDKDNKYTLANSDIVVTILNGKITEEKKGNKQNS
jgi:hypothetical protein